ncbi:hypothetical protein TWF481_001445 [Arthrobotrys musiformis]|uniref:Uncharacterized protein n=1 Tax=Arthrobotrys musiformis TaxID=47236 RepID=A0AAV9WS04_9PEZI
MQDKVSSSHGDIRHVLFRVTLSENLSIDTLEEEESSTIPSVARSLPPNAASKTLSRPKIRTLRSGFPFNNKAKSLPSLHLSTTLPAPKAAPQPLSQAPVKPSGTQQDSEPAITMKEKDKENSKRRRSSRRQSILSLASTYFGPMALGSDISLDRQISPALQTSHVFFGDDTNGNSPSPYSLSQTRLPVDASPTTSAALAPSISQGPDLPSLASPTHPSPPAPSPVTSTQLTPAVSGGSGNSKSGGSTTTPATTTSAPAATRRGSKLSSIGSFLPSLSESRRTSIASFFRSARDIPSRIFRRSSTDSASPPPLRSTCTITEKDTMPPKNRRPTKAEKDALRRRKAADKYIKKKTKKRLRRDRRETKRRLSKTEEAKEARKWMSKTPKLLQVMDDAKEKFWEWLDKREEKKRRRRSEAHAAMREERRKSVVLVPVERDYEVLSRRGSRYSRSGSVAQGSTERPGILERAE